MNTFTIFVLVNIINISAEKYITVDEGSTAVLSCKTSDNILRTAIFTYSPSPNNKFYRLNIYFNGTVLNNNKFTVTRLGLQDYILQIKNISVSNVGSYDCLEHRKDSETLVKIETYVLTVNISDTQINTTLTIEPVKQPNTYGGKRVSPGSNVEINCGNNKVLLWLKTEYVYQSTLYKNGNITTEYTNHFKYSIKNNSLYIVNISIFDNGFYSCYYVDNNGKLLKQIQYVFIFFFAFIKHLPVKTVFAQVGSTVNFDCNSTSVYWGTWRRSDDSYMGNGWFNGGNYVIIDKFKKTRPSIFTDKYFINPKTQIDQSLQIFNITTNDEGIYSCLSLRNDRFLIFYEYTLKVYHDQNFNFQEHVKLKNTEPPIINKQTIESTETFILKITSVTAMTIAGLSIIGIIIICIKIKINANRYNYIRFK